MSKIRRDAWRSFCRRQWEGNTPIKVGTTWRWLPAWHSGASITVPMTWKEADVAELLASEDASIGELNAEAEQLAEDWYG